MTKINEWPADVTDISSEAGGESEPVSRGVLTKNLENLVDNYTLLKADVSEVERRDLRERITVAINELVDLTDESRDDIYKDFLQRGFPIPSGALYPNVDI